MAINLKILSPFICKGTGATRWGVDASFHRDQRGRFCIPRSHIKGKLREAWGELNHCHEFSADVDSLLGKKPGDGDYLAYPGAIVFSDFICSGDARDCTKLHRIKIEKATGTAQEGALITAEIPYASGEISDWKGEALFAAPCEKEAQDLKSKILIGLRWIHALGAEKGVGFGRLAEAVCEEFDAVPARYSAVDSTGVSEILGLRIKPLDPLIIGGVRRKANYLESERILSGNIIKGALAASIRRQLCLRIDAPIGPCAEMEREGLSLLASHFEKIRITHAFPSLVRDKRPVVYPLSLVKVKNRKGVFDVALADNPPLPKDEYGIPSAPTFAIDWKDSSDVDEEFGWANPKTIARTRTAIEPLTRRAMEEMLYTFQYICPVDDQGRGIYWLSNIFLPEGLDDKESKQLQGELAFVLTRWLQTIGKRNSRVETVEVSVGVFVPAVEFPDRVRDGAMVITLQSDALILDPVTLRGNDRDALFEAYRAFWEGVSSGTCSLTRFFASQKLVGGYLGLRFGSGGKYFPFLLTGAGSVFVLQAVDEKAAEHLTAWLKKGLPTPAWAVDRYGGSPSGGLDWQKCPFTPENGFGEIAANLPHHWTNVIGRKS
ncbi:MAG: hypothetical protein C4530_09190 [Desulfobacteraceae bacterium]|nr:MAG: hypothetical protein C4530_09190 [Desulfobacteraceae bacterium]